MKHKYHCGLCGSLEMTRVLDLGWMPLANAFHEEGVEVPSYPLIVYFCTNCTSLQLLDIVDPNVVFKKYEYLTSASKPLSDHFRRMGIELADRFIDSEDDLMVEIGGNDGVLLKAVKHKCRVLNIDPAETACEMARLKGVPTIDAFFDLPLAYTIRAIHGGAKVVVANNVMAHIEDFHGVMQGIRHLMLPNAVFVFEVHWVGNLIGEGGFDQIYHEHLFYHSLTALQRQIPDIFDVDIVPVHGQSMRIYVGNYPITQAVDSLIRAERQMGLASVDTYLQLKYKIEKNKEKLHEILRSYKSVVGYGAPAKGNMLINALDLSLDFIIDTTVGKQGLYTPGKNIRVLPPSALYENLPTGILILAWNYAKEIMAKERGLNVDWIIPVPEVKVIKHED